MGVQGRKIMKEDIKQLEIKETEKVTGGDYPDVTTAQSRVWRQLQLGFGCFVFKKRLSPTYGQPKSLKHFFNF